MCWWLNQVKGVIMEGQKEKNMEHDKESGLFIFFGG